MLLLILLLSACRRATTPEPTSTLSPTGTSAATAASPTKRPSSTATSFSTEVAAVPSASPSAITQLPVLSPTAAAPTGGAGPYPAPGLSTPPPPPAAPGLTLHRIWVHRPQPPLPEHHTPVPARRCPLPPLPVERRIHCLVAQCKAQLEHLLQHPGANLPVPNLYPPPGQAPIRPPLVPGRLPLR